MIEAVVGSQITKTSVRSFTRHTNKMVFAAFFVKGAVGGEEKKEINGVNLVQTGMQGFCSEESHVKS